MNFFEATRILKNYCEEQENDCKGCMFYLHEPGRGCRISDDIPCDWELLQRDEGKGYDPVHHPPHYSWRGFEGIDLIKKFVKKQKDSFLARQISSSTFTVIP